MSERRYVVEIARAVSDDRIETAADYIAVRLGMDKQRIRMLLASRTGPVTKPVLAEKADSIAEVFTAAGVSVLIMEASEREEPELLTSAGSDVATAGDPARGAVTDYEAEYEEEFGQRGFEDESLDDEALDDEDYEDETLDDSGEPRDRPWPAASDTTAAPDVDTWNVDSAWQAEDDDAPWGIPPAHAAAAAEHAAAEHAAAEHAGEEHANAEQTNTVLAGDTQAGAQVPRDDRPFQGGDSRLPTDTSETKLPSTRWVPSPFDDPHDTDRPSTANGSRRGEDLKVSWGDAAAEPYSLEATDRPDPGGDSTGFEPVASRPWVTPGRSQFGDMSPPTDRVPLRTYLMWALVVSVVLLIVLQLVFAVRERGSGDATYESGLAAYRTGDFVTARRTWEEVAKSGSPEAQYMLGHLLENGLGQPWSNARAAVWYRQAADQGLPEAQAALADLYIRGVGVEPSLETGAQWLQRAAAAGYPPALYRYAELLLHGRGVTQDFDSALELFARAADSGSSEAADYVALADHVRASALVGSGQQ